MVRNDRNPKFCAVRAILRICHRVALLHNPPTYPLAIYQSTSSKMAFLSHKDMDLLLKGASKAVYNLSKKDLQKFIVHSLRVGACVMLHTACFSADDIKFELRWRSDAFRDYLRNILSLAGSKALYLTNFDPDTVPF